MRFVSRRPDREIDTAVQATIRDAEQLWTPETFQGEYPDKGIGIRRLVAKDFVASGQASGGFGTPQTAFGAPWAYSQAAASAWETWINGTLSDSVYVVITGIFSLDALENIIALKFTIDGKEYPIMNLQELYAMDVARVYFSKPIVVRPEKSIVVKMWGRAAKTGSLGLLGWAIGKRSYLIAES